MSGNAALFAGAGASPFGRRQRRARGGRIPVTIVTGFLGSGKTTLIRHLLTTPEGADTAVIVNEYGEVGIDDALLRGSSDTTVLLGNGCVCCLMRSDLQETLRTLFAERSQGTVPNFRRVIIETSGLADPGPVLQTFASDRALGGEFHLQSLVGVIDAVSGPDNLARMPEARHQIALSDRIVLTKPDLAPAPAVEALTERLHALGTAPVAIARDGELDPAFVFGDEFGAPVAPAAAGAQGQGVDPEAAAPRLRGHDDDGELHDHDHDYGQHEHADGIASFTVFFDRPLAWPAFEQAMAVLTALRGPDLLRVKGLVAVEGCRGPVVVHAVQHTAHRPVELENWPTEDRRSRLVFITRNLAREPVEALFTAVAGVV
jgi:G3E family GTPase